VEDSKENKKMEEKRNLHRQVLKEALGAETNSRIIEETSNSRTPSPPDGFEPESIRLSKNKKTTKPLVDQSLAESFYVNEDQPSFDFNSFLNPQSKRKRSYKLTF